MRTLLRTLVLLLVLLVFCIGCKKSATSPDTSQPPTEANWVTRQQVDISWPSLANSPWPTYLHDFQHTGRSPYRGPQEGKVDWFYQTSKEVFSSAVIGTDGTIYIQGHDHNLYALTPTGAVKWTFDMRYASEALTTIGADGTIYAGANQHGTLFALDQNGTKKWEYSTGGSGHWRAPLISRDGQTIYFMAGDSTVNAISLFALTKDGSFKWKFTPPQKDLSFNSPAFSPDGRVIYCPGQGIYDASFYAVDTTGTMLWRFPVSGRGGNNTYVGEPSVDNDGSAYFVCSGMLYSVTSNGSLRWQAACDAGDYNGPVIAGDGTIYVGGSSLYAFDYSGKKKWQFAGSAMFATQSIPAVDKDGTIYIGTVAPVGSDTTNFFAINPNGSVKWRLSLRGSGGLMVDVASRPAINSDGKIYIGSDGQDGKRIFAIK